MRMTMFSVPVFADDASVRAYARVERNDLLKPGVGVLVNESGDACSPPAA
jgi:hypothetical protein